MIDDSYEEKPKWLVSLSPTMIDDSYKEKTKWLVQSLANNDPTRKKPNG